MASKNAAARVVGLRSSAKRTLRFGLVNVGVSWAPVLDDAPRVSGRRLDPDTLTPVKQQYVNEAGDVVKPITGYAYGDSFVVLEPGDLESLESDDTIELTANVADSEIPAEWIETTYLAWPTDATHSESFGLVSHYLRSYARAFIGTTVANGTTKTFVFRWSETYGTVVAQLLSYHSQVRWANVEIAREGIAGIAEPTAEMAGLAKGLFEAIPSTFDWANVRDLHGEHLTAAIAEKAENGTVTPATLPAKAEAANDLMAALRASIPAPTPETADVAEEVTA